MKAGYVSIIGKPNVGKSTLLNRMLGMKLSIVSKKPQTTRNRILGILTEGDYQCYFIDTPGMLEPAYELQSLMLEKIKSAIEDSDLIILMTDPWFERTEFPADFLRLAKRKPIIGVINKIDLAAKSKLLPIMEGIKNIEPKEIIPISALTGDGIELLKTTIFDYLPDGPFLYPGEDVSDQPERFFVAELIRERVFAYFKKEIPYATCVVIEEFKEREKGKDYIRAVIYVEKESQKSILIGKGGEALKKIGEGSRKEIEKFLERYVYLDLWVKVKESWRKDRRFLKEIGY